MLCSATLRCTAPGYTSMQQVHYCSRQQRIRQHAAMHCAARTMSEEAANEPHVRERLLVRTCSFWAPAPIRARAPCCTLPAPASKPATNNCTPRGFSMDTGSHCPSDARKLRHMHACSHPSTVIARSCQHQTDDTASPAAASCVQLPAH